jgi:UDP-GlcNAc:undecaprenyl-phosphate/decaprenyl-phosphate GlcNAc-1-phosphate transferase
MDVNVKSTLAAFMIAFAVSAALTPVVRRLALAAGALDEAGGRRVHVGRIPRLGGLAVATAFFIPLLALFALDSSLGRQFFEQPRRIVALGVGSAVVLALGALDDLRGVGARTKLAGQCIAAVVAWWGGFDIHMVILPLVGRIDMTSISLLVTVLWFVGVINALNLIDGLDGLAAGIAFFACLTNLVVGSMNDSLLVMLLSAALGGGLLGFLVYNFNPASIFMGDSGSMFLGYVLAATSLLGSTIKSSTTVAILVPIIALGVPITDTVWAFARRIKARQSIFSADRGHIHHRLLDIGLSQRRAVILLYSFSLTLTVAATGLALGRSLAAGGALVVMATMLIGVVRTARAFTLRRARPIPQRARRALVESLRATLPQFLRHINGGSDLPSTMAALHSFVERSGMAEYSLQLPREPFGDIALLRDQLPLSSSPVWRIEYPLPSVGASARITFWLRDSHDDDQVHVLLQLVADALEAKLEKVAMEPASEVPSTNAIQGEQPSSVAEAAATGYGRQAI